MENYKIEIARQLNQLNNGSFGVFSDTLRNIDNAVQWAWENWDKDVISSYYLEEKPERPTENFINEWVDNADFEADGYNVENLIDLFG